MLIGDLAAAAGRSAKAIRFYEHAGLMPAPPRTPAGYRDYPPAAAGRLAFIRQAQAAGFTLAEIRGILRVRDGGQAPCHHVTRLISEHLAQVEARITELTAPAPRWPAHSAGPQPPTQRTAPNRTSAASSPVPEPGHSRRQPGSGIEPSSTCTAPTGKARVPGEHNRPRAGIQV